MHGRKLRIRGVLGLVRLGRRRWFARPFELWIDRERDDQRSGASQFLASWRIELSQPMESTYDGLELQMERAALSGLDSSANAHGVLQQGAGGCTKQRFDLLVDVGLPRTACGRTPLELKFAVRWLSSTRLVGRSQARE
jgi:hypothetical protein